MWLVVRKYMLRIYTMQENLPYPISLSVLALGEARGVMHVYFPLVPSKSLISTPHDSLQTECNLKALDPNCNTCITKTPLTLWRTSYLRSQNSPNETHLLTTALTISEPLKPPTTYYARAYPYHTKCTAHSKIQTISETFYSCAVSESQSR